MIWPFTNRLLENLAAETLSLEHAHAVADIHASTFSPAWTDGDFIALLNKRNVGGVVLREPISQGGRVAGFVLVRVVVDEAEILTIAVTPTWQNRGVGNRLMTMVLANLHAENIPSLFLEVDEANKNAVSLYSRLGFRQVATRENYYRRGSGDKSNALVLRKDVG